jgi:ATP-dependent protease HslVU (ClpYQ) peptidase subunit
MTTIVYRDGVMAADTRAFSGDKHPIGQKIKIRRLEDGTLLGASSTKPGAGEAVLDWYAAGKPDNIVLPDDFTFIAAHPDGRVFYSCEGGERLISGPLSAPFFTIGSGEQYAHGACLMGATAVEAVRAACQADPWSDFPIMEITHKRKLPRRFDR